MVARLVDGFLHRDMNTLHTPIAACSGCRTGTGGHARDGRIIALARMNRPSPMPQHGAAAVAEHRTNLTDDGQRDVLRVIGSNIEADRIVQGLGKMVHWPHQ